MIDRGFEILPHTTDMRLKVWGKTLEELFRSALRGMVSYWKPEALEKNKREFKEKKEIKIKAPDLTSLLIEFLSKTIAQTDILNTVFADVSFREFGENFLEGDLHGLKVDGLEKDIKAVSFQEVDIKKNPETGLYETVLVFDI